MCGICGMVYADPHAPVDEAALDRMAEALRHRGPDDGHRWTGPGAGLAARRLSVIDVEHGRQPMVSPDGRHVLAFNGEIYNFRELRGELKGRGREFRTDCDTEVVLAAFETWGRDALERFNGMFALAWYDTAERRILLARDRAGVKPLFYTFQNGRLVFASELGALHADGALTFSLDPVALDVYLTHLYIPAPKTIFAGIDKLAPASYVEFTATPKSQPAPPQRFWQPRFEPDPNWTDTGAAARFRELLHEVVQRQCVSDVPLGAFLSGGMDSSAVVSALASGGPVDTFTVGFEKRRYDERRYAKAVADAYQTNHHETGVALDAVGILDDCVARFGEPFADSSAIPTWAIAEFARQHVTVALSGDGGDELFGGYTWMRTNRRAARLRELPPSLRAVMTATAAAIPPSPRKGKVQRFLNDAGLSPIESYRRRHTALDAEQRVRLYTPAMVDALRAPETWDPFLEHASAALKNVTGRQDDTDEWMLQHDFAMYLPDDVLTKVDRMSMAHSLEVRVPLLDNAMLDFAFSLPFAMKLRNGQSKWIMKEALNEDLPRTITRQRKQGFSVPVHAWFRGSLAQRFRETVLAPDSPIAEFIQPDHARQFLNAHQRRRDHHGHRLWALLVLETWLRQSNINLASK